MNERKLVEDCSTQDELWIAMRSTPKNAESNSKQPKTKSLVDLLRQLPVCFQVILGRLCVFSENEMASSFFLCNIPAEQVAEMNTRRKEFVAGQVPLCASRRR